MNKNILNVTYDDIRGLKITKVSQDKNLVRFKLKGLKFQLDQEVWGIVLSLYNSSMNEYERYCHVNTNRLLKDIVYDRSKNNQSDRATYTNIDKLYLMKVLTEVGMFRGYFDNLCNLVRDEQKKLDGQIKDLEADIQRLKAAKEELYEVKMGISTHGKLYKRGIKEKASDRHLGTGYQFGDYIKKLHASIGDTHPHYGGILMDLRNLKYGTVIHCCNGDYNAMVDCDNHGDKALTVCNSNKDYDPVKITEENCLMYIEIL